MYPRTVLTLSAYLPWCQDIADARTSLSRNRTLKERSNLTPLFIAGTMQPNAGPRMPGVVGIAVCYYSSQRKPYACFHCKQGWNSIIPSLNPEVL